VVHATNNMKAKQKKYSLYFLAMGLFLLVFIVVYLRYAPTATPLLFMSTDNAVLNGAPISVVDLDTNTISNLKFSADGCDGVSFDGKSRLVRISCRIGVEAYVDYDLCTARLSTGTPPFTHRDSFRTPLACGNFGKCYYGFGHIGKEGDSLGRIVITKDGVMEKTVDLPNRKSNMIPVNIQLVDRVLFVLERGPSGQSSVITRFDVMREEFVGESIAIGADAWGMAVGGGVVAVSVDRTTLGKDVLLFDAQTGMLTDSMLVLGEETAFNAYGLEIHAGVLYVAGIAGVSAYALDGLSFLGNHPTADFALEIAYGNEHVYVTIPNLQTILELSPKTLNKEREFHKPTGFGLIHIIDTR
jgi:hypothetical protein